MSNINMEQEKETYYVGDEQSTRYFSIVDDNTVKHGDCRISIPRERFMDFIATAKVLGLKAGKI